MLERTIQERIHFANLLMGAGLLLTIVPLGIGILHIISPASPGTAKQAAVIAIWTYGIIIMGLLPIGLATFFLSLTWMTYLRKQLAKAELDADEAEEKAAA